MTASGSQGQKYQILYKFTDADQATNPSVLIQGQDGALYGVLGGGIAAGSGMVFKINPDGSNLVLLHSLGLHGYGSGPLLQGKDGALYGMTPDGGMGGGTIFKINSDGSGYVVLSTFSDFGAGEFPNNPPIQGKDGTLYGTTNGGGAHNVGTVFKINPDGTNLVTLHSFSLPDKYGNNSDGAFPRAGLLQDKNGTLYGTTTGGGANRWGTVFKINPDGSGIVTLHNFGQADNPSGGFRHNSDGIDSFASLLQGKDGALYGTTYEGGMYSNGTLFKLNPDGTNFVVLHTFSQFDSNGHNSDGAAPSGSLIQGRDGTLYGSTGYGGANGTGTIFKLNPDGSNFVILYTFSPTDKFGYNSDGAHPSALRLSKYGFLHGTAGGGPRNDGMLFRLLASPPRFDANGDSNLDLLWYNNATTALIAWLQNGTTTLGTASLATSVDPHWQFTGVADLNGDGSADLLWRNSQTGDLVVWYMQGSAYLGYAYVAHNLPLSWQIVSSADLNSDGNPDLILRNNQTGDVVVWYLKGVTVSSYAYLAHAVALNWQLVGSADMVGDGHTDLLWRNSQNGDLGVWHLNNTQLVSSYTLAAGVPLEWQIGEIGDLNGDGVPDIVWRNTKTGDVTAWLFSDATHFTGAFIATGVPLAWQLVGPR